VPGQWAVQTALGGKQSIYELTKPGGRLYETRRVVAEALSRSKYLEAVVPQGALYVFVRVKQGAIPHFDDQQFALQLLEKRHILITPGHGFNVPYKDAFRITLLPDTETMKKVLATIEEAVAEYARA
jgi:alanine-synthesizing transaminase